MFLNSIINDLFGSTYGRGGISIEGRGMKENRDIFSSTVREDKINFNCFVFSLGEKI